MRQVKEKQMKIGELPISEIKFDLRSRDEIPKLLLGLQYIYCTHELREKIFTILEEMISVGIDKQNGRPGMELWKILVIGTLRLNCNWDYDKVHEMSNNHNTLRQMLGHGAWDFKEQYKLQTIKDNVKLLTPEILDKINEVVVKHGQSIVLKKNEKIKGKCDSFVVETNVHFSTDINILFDAIRKVITLIALLCDKLEIAGWRKYRNIIGTIKSMYRIAQKAKGSKAKSEKLKLNRENKKRKVYEKYLKIVKKYLKRAKESLKESKKQTNSEVLNIIEMIEKYIKDAERQIGQIRRRVLEGETIPHSEKVFSIFEEHTEWICKGKAGVTHELGAQVCIIEDQNGFILNHRVMEKITDVEICEPIVEETKRKYPNLNSCSFDRGFHSPENKKSLSKLLNKVVLPKKGKPAEEEKTEEFKSTKRKHSAVESAINALENHGLDKCPDHGIDGFKRYVSLAILSRNIQILGTIIQRKKLKSEKRRKKYNETLERNRLRKAA